MNNIMIDIETMGTTSSAAIIAIGAAFFDLYSGKTGKHFYVTVSLSDCLLKKAQVDADTIYWWLQQSEEARMAVIKNQGAAFSLDESLVNFTVYLKENSCPENLRVWGNGPAFDNVILRNAYALCHLDCPLMFWNDRDVRTILDIGKGLGFDAKKEVPFMGIPHHALDDALHQIKMVTEVWKRIFSDNSHKN